MKENSERETIYIMADYGMAAYAWRKGNIADSVTGFPEEFGVSKELEAKFAEWAIDFERNCDKPHFDWKDFHKRGIELTKNLKEEIGNQFNIEYHKPIQDPRWGEDHEAYENWMKGKVVLIED